MKKYEHIAKGSHVIIRKLDEQAIEMEFDDEEVEVDKIKYLKGHIVSVGHLVDKEEYEVGMLVKCAKFVAAKFGDGLYGLDSEDIMEELREIK